MKFILYGAFAILLCLTWSCNDEALSTPIPLPNEADDTVSIHVPLTHLIVEEIEILQFPKRNPDGNHWELENEDWPDFYVSFKEFGATSETISDTLEYNPGYVQDYTIVSRFNHCYASPDDAILLKGPDHLVVPLNFRGELRLMDVEMLCGFTSECGALWEIEMHSFSLTPTDYVVDRPREIFFTSEEECQYILRIIVRWV